MLLRVEGLIGLALAASQLLSAAAEPSNTQSEWRFLPTDYVDPWSGAFHDGGTGAFIVFERGFRSMLSESAPSVAAEHGASLVRGKKGAWAYSYVILPVVGERAVRWSDSCAEDRTEYQRVEASFTSDAAPYVVWNFTAFTCARQERASVFDFLFSDPNRWASLMDAEQPKVRELRERDITRLVRGEGLARLQLTLGMPNSVERRGAGFDLSFSLVHSQTPAEARLHFDRAGKLVDWKLESPPARR